MPSKSKDGVSEWSQCLKCKVIVYSKELSKHRRECETSQTLSHGHVRGNVLYGVVSLHQEYKSPVPVRQKDTIVLLHPSTIQFCGLYIGGEIIVANSHIMTVWPCSDICPSTIGISEPTMVRLCCFKGSIVTVEPFIDCHDIADDIQLMPSGEWHGLYEEDNFMKYLKKSAVGKFFKNGNQVTISYFGQDFSFIVEIIECKRSNRKLFSVESDLESNSLENKLTDLSITDESMSQHDASNSSIRDGVALLCTSTPVVAKDVSRKLNNTQLYDNVSLNDINLESPNISHQSHDISPQEDGNILKCNQSPVKMKHCSVNLPQTPTSNSPVSRNSYFCTPDSSKSVSSVGTLPSQFYKVVPSTKFNIKSLDSSVKVLKADVQTILYSDLGGLTSQIEILKDFLHLPLQSPEIFKTYGLPQPRGVLIFGPSGCGKSTLIQAVIAELNIHCVNISGPEIWSKFYGETEQKLKSLFQEAKQRSPSLIVIDDVDSLCPRRENTNSDLEKRVVASFLTLIDGISDSKEDHFVMVLGTTSKPDSIDPALRRPGRFDKEIEIGVPSAVDRREILQRVLKKCQTDLDSDDIAAVADNAHGYVGADLVALVKEASLHAIKNRVSNTHDNSLLSITKRHLDFAMNIIQPSAMREVQIEVPKVYWTEIGGQEEIKLKLKQAVEWPLKHPEAFDRMGISPPKGILMYGPPGCSKTMIAKALATESGLNFLAVKGPELFSKWVGESERAVREVFRKARAAAPSIVFFDEMDALAIERGSSSGGSNVADRVLAQLLTEIDGVEKLKDVTIVAATNRPDMIDKALLRPGRIDRILFVPLPDDATRKEIFRIKLSNMPIHEDITASWLAERSSGYTGAEITSVCHEAAMFALQEDILSTIVHKSHFEMALVTVTPRISGQLLNFYENYHQSSGLHTI